MEPNNNTLPPEYLPDPFQQTITLGDGTIMNGRGALNEITDELFIWPDDEISLIDGINIFSDTNKTNHIRIDYSKVEHNEYDGYTRVYSITSNPPGKLSIRLRKEVN